eukprot:scaffold97939_cov47-Phaeocystis_antarctica.AAC.2
MHAASGPCPLRLGPTTMSSLPFSRGARRAVDALRLRRASSSAPGWGSRTGCALRGGRGASAAA